MASLVNSIYKTIQKRYNNYFLKLFQKLKKKETIQTHFVNQFYPDSKTRQRYKKKKLNKIKLEPVFLMNISVKFFSKFFSN